MSRTHILFGLWVSVLALGFLLLHRSEFRPGAGGSVADWDDGGGHRPPVTDGVLFVHPKCPCSRTTLRAMRHLEAGVVGRIVFVGTDDADAAWWAGDSWDDACAVPGACVTRDPGGRLARAVGVRTSGHLVIRSAGGRLVFSGGIAVPGVSAADAMAEVRAAIRSSVPTPVRRPVYGCPLEHGESAGLR